MLFNSFDFCLFFGIVVCVYFVLSFQLRWVWLLFASIFFYMYVQPMYIVVLGSIITIDYVAAIKMDSAHSSKRKLWFLGSIFANLGILFCFKYYNFFNALLGQPFIVSDFLLPLGLSFHTFQSLSYTAEVYAGRQRAELHYGYFALYVLFFPQLVAGPIERPQSILSQFRERHVWEHARVVSGLRLVLWGLFKKVVIADRLGYLCDMVFDSAPQHKGFTILMAVLFFGIQIFCDFSGYTDIARGTARILGIRLMDNFKQPYFSVSLSTFWRNWHISLSSWFRDYVYIPLGGGKYKPNRNIMITFLLSGLWHGANLTFVVWGGLHGLFLIIEKYIVQIFGHLRMPIVMKYLMRLISISLVFLLWIFFRAHTLSDAFILFSNIPSIAWYQVGPYSFDGDPFLVYMAIGLILFLFWVEYLSRHYQDIAEWLECLPKLVRWGFYWLLCLAITNLGVFENRTFIYFQF